MKEEQIEDKYPPEIMQGIKKEYLIFKSEYLGGDISQEEFIDQHCAIGMTASPHLTSGKNNITILPNAGTLFVLKERVVVKSSWIRRFLNKLWENK